MIASSDSPREGLNLHRVIETADLENRAADGSVASYADRVELGYKALEIGLWELARDNHAGAERWLQTAVAVGIEDAQPLLDICREAVRPEPRPADMPEPDGALPRQPATAPDASTGEAEGAGTPIYWEVAARMSKEVTTAAADSDTGLAAQYERLFEDWSPWRERVMPRLLAEHSRQKDLAPTPPTTSCPACELPAAQSLAVPLVTLMFVTPQVAAMMVYPLGIGYPITVDVVPLLTAACVQDCQRGQGVHGLHPAVRRRTLPHGDLHALNLLSRNDSAGSQAWIIDTHRDVVTAEGTWTEVNPPRPHDGPLVILLEDVGDVDLADVLTRHVEIERDHVESEVDTGAPKLPPSNPITRCSR